MHPDPWRQGQSFSWAGPGKSDYLCRQDSLVQTPWVRLRLGLLLLSSAFVPLPSECLLMLSWVQEALVCAVDVDFFLFFLFFLKSCLLLQVLTQENLATVLTGVVVPAGAVTQPLLIPISIAGQVSGQQGLAVWTIPTAAVAALPGLAAASPTAAVFKPPLAGLQGNGNSPQDCTGPPPPYTATPARVLTMLDSEPAVHLG